MLLIKDLILPNGVKVSFKLSDHEFKIIHGPNGCGKSLLLKSIALLVKSDFSEFVYNGKSIYDIKPEEYRSQVVYVPGSTLIQDMTVEEYLAYPRDLAVYKNRSWTDESQALAKSFGIFGKDLSLLSMGQKQILSLIRCLYLNAKVLLLDEPTSHLDPEMTLMAEKLILDWKLRNDGSVVIISHDLAISERMKIQGILFSELVQSQVNR